MVRPIVCTICEHSRNLTMLTNKEAYGGSASSTFDEKKNNIRLFFNV